jgi:LysR family glycine cleavage system transcriptional activator
MEPHDGEARRARRRVGRLLQVVLAGQGAGLLPAAMVAPEVAAGRLVRLAGIAWLEAFGYYLVYPEAALLRPKVAAFRRWLLEAARSC